MRHRLVCVESVRVSDDIATAIQLKLKSLEGSTRRDPVCGITHRLSPQADPNVPEAIGYFRHISALTGGLTTALT